MNNMTLPIINLHYEGIHYSKYLPFLEQDKDFDVLLMGYSHMCKRPERIVRIG